MQVMVDAQGQANGIQLTWLYDDFFSLLIFEDMGLDPDGDAQLSQGELDRLFGFDMIEWPPGFEGDLCLYRGDEKIALDHPVSTGIEVINGRIQSTHERSFAPTPAQGLTVLQYDPTYFVAYEMREVQVENGCTGSVVPPDLEAAQKVVQEYITDPKADIFEFVELGIHYAYRTQITCGTGG